MVEAGGGGGGAEEGVGESSTPRRAPAPTPASAASGGSGGGGGGAGCRNVCNEVFEPLLADDHMEAVGASGPELRARLEAHFARLPNSDPYQLDVNVDKAEEVSIDQKVLSETQDSEKRPAFSIRFLRLEEVNVDETTNSDALEEGVDIGEAPSTRSKAYTYIHEILFSTMDKPKLPSQLPALLSDIGLNIREAHVFSTTDGYSLDVFVVDGWPVEDTEGLYKALHASILRNELRTSPISTSYESDIDTRLLKIVKKVASGSCRDMFLGTYADEEVAVKILNPENLNQNAWHEFKQEICMLREVDHPNIVRFIGSCTKAPQFYIITEHMSRGSLFDFLHNEHNVLDLPTILKYALDVSRGMSYLHQKDIIHRDLKSANLLLGKDHVVKVAGFGLARFQDAGGAMTAETGTYRWIAPEVINHQPYDNKADVYSFAIVLWELMTSKIPYTYMNPLQAAVGVRQGLRPQLPENAHPKLLNLMQRCWEALPSDRPSFTDIITELDDIQARPQLLLLQGTWIPSSLPDVSPTQEMGLHPKIRVGCSGGPLLEEMGPPPKFHVGCVGGGGDGGGGSMERTPERAVSALPPPLKEIDWTPKIQVGSSSSARAPTLERTDALVKEAVDALPPPPGRGIWLNGALPHNDDPVALALDRRGIHPENRYDPYFDLFMFRRPPKEECLQAWVKFPLKLHDAGLVEAEHSIITWGSGLSGRRVDFTAEMTRILELHPGPVACLRLDDSAFPASERLRRWLDILTAKEVQQLILLNLTQPEDTQAPLHHLRSCRLTYLAIGLVNIRACLRLALEAADLDAHPWSSLKGVTLIACAFDGPDLSRTIRSLQHLRKLSIQSCPLTVACSEDGLQIGSQSLVTVQLLNCTADHKVTLGPAAALTHITLGVVPASKAAAASPPPLLHIEIVYCNSLKIVEQLNMQKQEIALVAEHHMKVHFRKTTTLRFVHTLVVAVEMATTHHGSLLVELLSYFPNLKVLSIQRIDDNTSDGVCPHADSVPCLANSLQHLRMQQFRGGSVEVMFVVYVLAVARFLSTVIVEWHPTPLHRPQDATSSVQPHPTTLHWQDAASHFHRCRQVSKHCDIIVVPPTSDKV